MPLRNATCTNEKCKKYNKEVEVLIKITQDLTKLVECEECHEKTLQISKSLGKTGFTLVGRGWYADGY